MASVHPKVAFVKVVPEARHVLASVQRAMRLADWEHSVQGNTIFVKINTLSFPLVPGTNTSPWVLEGVLRELRARLPAASIAMGDSEIIGTGNVDKAGRIWGYERLAQEYDVRFVNLAKEPVEEVELAGYGVKRALFPRIVLEADSLITVPVMKCHHLATITAALKNQWGCLPMARHNLHPVLHDVIVDINLRLRPALAVIDGTIAMEGKGPRTGTPKVCDVVIVSTDPVAADAVAARYMGFDPWQIKYLRLAQERSLGSIECDLVGDEFASNPFEPPSPNPVAFLHRTLRASPLRPLLFETPLVNLLAKMAFWYNTYYWYRFIGRGLTESILHNSGYSAQFPDAG